MRVRLKGLNRTSKRLADGSRVTYHYAWKGGPRLEGKPGSPDFMAAYHAAIAKKLKPAAGILSGILDAYQEAADFKDLAERTRSDYRRQIRVIESEFAEFPLAALNDRRTRGEFMAWRDRLAVRSKRQADYAYSVLALVLAWAFNRGLVPLNPCERGGRVYRATRKDNVWSEADEADFLKHAPPHLALALTLALWTGQRQGDLLRLTWSAYSGSHIRLKQGKTGTRIAIPVGAPLKAILDATTRRAVTILATSSGTSWTEGGFRASWRTACAKAGVKDVTFHDLRGTAVTRLAVAGCTAPEIGAITGHSLRDVNSILDSAYLSRDPELAKSAIRKLEKRTKLPTKRPTGT